MNNLKSLGQKQESFGRVVSWIERNVELLFNDPRLHKLFAPQMNNKGSMAKKLKMRSKSRMHDMMVFQANLI